MSETKPYSLVEVESGPVSWTAFRPIAVDKDRLVATLTALEFEQAQNRKLQEVFALAQQHDLAIGFEWAERAQAAEAELIEEKLLNSKLRELNAQLLAKLGEQRGQNLHDTLVRVHSQLLSVRDSLSTTDTAPSTPGTFDSNEE